MGHLLRELRRAPARILASVFALALALGAIGVIGVPEVASSSLREAAAADRIANIAIDTTDTGAVAVEPLVEAVAGVDDVDAHVFTVVDAGVDTNGDTDDVHVAMLGIDAGEQDVDIVRADEGRLPTGADEVLVTEGLAPLGARLSVGGVDGHRSTLTVVGVGGTSYWSGEEIAFTSTATARALAGVEGANRIVVHAAGDADALRVTTDAIRTQLAAHGVDVVTLPDTVPDGEHPIEADIAQISMLIGLLGIVAGLVALVLLGSTTTTLVTERAGEVAVMRALGGRRRTIRRRLRATALAIAAAAVVVGVPLGVVVSNSIARMVLGEFVGLTPALAVSVPVVIGSVVFALVGARLVAARAARRVTDRPLADALRDREASPFGRRFTERVAAKLRLAGLLERCGLRNALHQRSRSLGMLAQITAAVAALMVVTSMATTVTAFNDAEYEHWRYETWTSVPGPGLDMDAGLADGDDRSETAIATTGEYDDWEIEVFGLEAGSAFVDPVLDAGRWYRGDGGGGEVVLSTGFAERVGVDVGDEIVLRLASGTAEARVVGLHPARGRIAFAEVAGLASTLGSPGMADALLSLDDPPASTPPGTVQVERLDDLADDDSGRNAVLLVFTAVGLVIVSVAGLAVASGLAVNVHERRHELAALQAIGGRRRHVMRVVVAELGPLAIAGVALGVALGYAGAAALVAAFEAGDAVEIGLTFATGAIPVAAAAVVVGSLGLAALMARRVTRRPAAVTLRGAG